jgi:hypothetical protein
MGKQPVVTAVVSTTLTRRQLKLKQLEQEKLDQSMDASEDVTMNVSTNEADAEKPPVVKTSPSSTEITEPTPVAAVVETAVVAPGPTGNKRGRKPGFKKTQAASADTSIVSSTTADESIVEAPKTVESVVAAAKETEPVTETPLVEAANDVEMNEVATTPVKNHVANESEVDKDTVVATSVVSPKVLAELTTNQEQPTPPAQVNGDIELLAKQPGDADAADVQKQPQELITDINTMTEEEMRADIKSVKKIKAAANQRQAAVLGDKESDVFKNGNDAHGDDDEDYDDDDDSDMDDMDEFESDSEHNDSENKLNGSTASGNGSGKSNGASSASKEERDKLRRRLPISIKELIDYHSGNGKSIKEIVNKINQVCKSEEKVSYGYVQKYLYRKKLEATTAKKARYYRKKYGFVYRRMRRKPVLTEHHRSLRLQWCGKYEDDQFDKDIFIGKTALKPFLASLNQLKGQQADPDMPKNQTTLHLWGAISRKGASPLQVRYFY